MRKLWTFDPLISGLECSQSLKWVNPGSHFGILSALFNVCSAYMMKWSLQQLTIVGFYSDKNNIKANFLGSICRIDQMQNSFLFSVGGKPLHILGRHKKTLFRARSTIGYLPLPQHPPPLYLGLKSWFFAEQRQNWGSSTPPWILFFCLPLAHCFTMLYHCIALHSLYFAKSWRSGWLCLCLEILVGNFFWKFSK